MNTSQIGNINHESPGHHWGVKQTVWAVVVLVVLVLIGVWLRGLVDTTHRTEEIKPGQEITYREGGLVIENFPREFLIEESVIVSESYSIAYLDAGVEQPAVRYTSGMTLAENVSAFRSVLADGDWEVLTEADAEAEGVTFFYATRGIENANITFAPREGGVEVTVSVARQVQ